MTDDLVTWLRARLDEDERLATLAANNGPGKWAYENRASGPAVVTEPDQSEFNAWERDVNYSVWTCDDPEDGCDEPRGVWRSEGKHIARHDPARVLREVEAKRRIVDLHIESVFPDGDPAGDCVSCMNEAWPCPTLRLLVLPHAGRPGYREEWKP